jgi:hypothetical protein
MAALMFVGLLAWCGSFNAAELVDAKLLSEFEKC